MKVEISFCCLGCCGKFVFQHKPARRGEAATPRRVLFSQGLQSPSCWMTARARPPFTAVSFVAACTLSDCAAWRISCACICLMLTDNKDDRDREDYTGRANNVAYGGTFFQVFNLP